jgi:hypothetical protein
MNLEDGRSSSKEKKNTGKKLRVRVKKKKANNKKKEIVHTRLNTAL